MTYFSELSFIELFYLVATVWLLFGVLLYPLARLQMKIIGIESVFGHSLSLVDCLEKGPVTGVMMAATFSSPEVFDIWNQELRKHHDND